MKRSSDQILACLVGAGLFSGMLFAAGCYIAYTKSVNSAKHIELLRERSMEHFKSLGMDSDSISFLRTEPTRAGGRICFCVEPRLELRSFEACLELHEGKIHTVIH